MGVRLYVCNIPYESTEDELRFIFEANGFRLSDATIVRRPEDGTSRGFGFVEVRDPVMAANAIIVMSGADLGGRPIKLAPALPRRAREAA